MKRDPLALSFGHRLKANAGNVALVFVAASLGLAGYALMRAPDAPVVMTTARVTGFGQDAGPKYSVGHANMRLDVQLADGRRWSRLIEADVIARCRIGQIVNVGRTTTRAGTVKILVPPDPCPRRMEPPAAR